MKKAVILGRGDTALGVIRSLAAAGIKVILLTTESRDHASYSRFVSESVKVPSPQHESSKLLDLIIRKKGGWDGALLLATNDISLAFVSQNREELSKRYVSAVPGWNVVRRIIDKHLLYRQAYKIGVPAPKAAFPDSVHSLRQAQNDFTYPCILKPYEIHRFTEFFTGKVLMVHNFEELVDKFKEAKRHKVDLMVSEIIPGSDSRLFHYGAYIDSQGQVLAEMCTQKLRQFPSNFGQGRVVRTVPMIEEIRDSALELLKSFSYHGISNTEFKLDPRDNQFKLMEINARPVLFERLFSRAGINFPYTAYMDLVEGVKVLSSDYETGIYWIHPFSETIEFLKLLKHKNLNLKDCLFPYRKRKVFCVSFFDDPVPFFVNASFFLPKSILKGLGVA